MLCTIFAKNSSIFNCWLEKSQIFWKISTQLNELSHLHLIILKLSSKTKNSLFFSLCATKKMCSLDRVAWVPFPDLEVIVDLDLDLVQDLETIVVVEEEMTGEEACLTLTRESGLQMHQGNIFKLFLIEIGLKPEMETIETGNCSWLKPKSSCFVASPIHCLLPLQRLKVTSF